MALIRSSSGSNGGGGEVNYKVASGNAHKGTGATTVDTGLDHVDVFVSMRTNFPVNNYCDIINTYVKANANADMANPYPCDINAYSNRSSASSTGLTSTNGGIVTLANGSLGNNVDFSWFAIQFD